MTKFAVMTDNGREVLGSCNSIVLDGRKNKENLIGEALEYFNKERKFSPYLTGFNIYSGKAWRGNLIHTYNVSK